MNSASHPKRCVSCVSWGADELPGDDPIWRWCSKGRASYAHIDFLCESYARLSKSAVDARNLRWGIAGENE
jgi:hypothetical protein